MNKNINITLTKDEALVLFEFLSRYSEKDELKIDHQSEQRVLWNLTGVFEKIISEPFRDNYTQMLNEARERLKDKE